MSDVVAERDALRSEVERLKSERDNWRLSSVCREKDSEIERLNKARDFQRVRFREIAMARARELLRDLGAIEEGARAQCAEDEVERLGERLLFMDGADEYQQARDNVKLRARCERLEGALRPFVDRCDGITDEWWCPACGITGSTYDSCCEYCGVPIGDCQPEIDHIMEARSALAAAPQPINKEDG